MSGGQWVGADLGGPEFFGPLAEMFGDKEDQCDGCGQPFDVAGYCEECSFCRECCTCRHPDDGPTERQIERMMDAPSAAEVEELRLRRYP